MSNKSLPMPNSKDVLERLKQTTGLSKDSEIAELIGLKKSNFSTRKKNNSLFCVIAEWAINEEIDLNWLLKGKEEDKKKLQPIIGEINEWLYVINKNDPGRTEWFRYHFEDSFPMFKKWVNHRESKERGDGDTNLESKVA